MKTIPPIALINMRTLLKGVIATQIAQRAEMEKVRTQIKHIREYKYSTPDDLKTARRLQILYHELDSRARRYAQQTVRPTHLAMALCKGRSVKDVERTRPARHTRYEIRSEMNRILNNVTQWKLGTHAVTMIVDDWLDGNT